MAKAELCVGEAWTGRGRAKLMHTGREEMMGAGSPARVTMGIGPGKAPGPLWWFGGDRLLRLNTWSLDGGLLRKD